MHTYLRIRTYIQRLQTYIHTYIRIHTYTYVRLYTYTHVVFFDNDLSTQLKANKVTRTAIDRYTIVLMAGIAAEALTVNIWFNYIIIYSIFLCILYIYIDIDILCNCFSSLSEALTVNFFFHIQERIWYIYYRYIYYSIFTTESSLLRPSRWKFSRRSALVYIHDIKLLYNDLKCIVECFLTS